ncbi:hypothetical protein AHF37_01245 [Paragonimus kellicotti]|nr:hypothetical protein AHF37_01245 [Paragonimus kellicotti]
MTLQSDWSRCEDQLTTPSSEGTQPILPDQICLAPAMHSPECDGQSAIRPWPFLVCFCWVEFGALYWIGIRQANG